MPGSLDPHMHRLREVEAEHLQPQLPSAVDFISGQMEQLGKCVLGSQSAVVSVSLLPVWAGHLRYCWVWVWRLLSLLWRTQSLSQINVKALLKWHPTHVRERRASSTFGLCPWIRLPGGLETDLWGGPNVHYEHLPAFVSAFDVDMDGFLRGAHQTQVWRSKDSGSSLCLKWLLTFLVGKIRRCPDCSLFFVLFHWGQSNIKGPLCKNESHSQLVKHWRFVIAGRVSCQPKSSVLNDTKKITFLKIWTFNYSDIGRAI